MIEPVILNFDFNFSPWQPLRKTPRFEDEKYIRFVKENFPCVRTGLIKLDNDFAHGINGKSKNRTASDLAGFPLDHWLHLDELHRRFGGNTVKWAEHFGIDLNAQCKRQVIAYALHVGLTGSFASLIELEIAFKKGKKWKRAA